MEEPTTTPALKKAMKKYYYKNQEKIIERSKDYYRTNRERVLEDRRRKYQEKKNQLRKRGKPTMEERYEKVIREIEERDEEFKEVLANYELEKGKEELTQIMEHIQYLENRTGNPINGKSLREIL